MMETQFNILGVLAGRMKVVGECLCETEDRIFQRLMVLQV